MTEGDTNGDGSYQSVSTGAFSIACGCDGDTEFADAGATASCEPGESFTITSSALSQLGGCYADTGLVSGPDDETLYSPVDDPETGDGVVVSSSGAEDESDVSTWSIHRATASLSRDPYQIYSPFLVTYHDWTPNYRVMCTPWEWWDRIITMGQVAHGTYDM